MFCEHPRSQARAPLTASSPCCCKNIRDKDKQVTLDSWLLAVRFLLGNAKSSCSYLSPLELYPRLL